MQWISAFAKMHCPRLSLFFVEFYFYFYFYWHGSILHSFCVCVQFHFEDSLILFAKCDRDTFYLFVVAVVCLCFFYEKKNFQTASTLFDRYRMRFVYFFSAFVFVCVCAGLCKCALSLCMWKFILLHFVIFAFVCNLFHNCFSPSNQSIIFDLQPNCSGSVFDFLFG